LAVICNKQLLILSKYSDITFIIPNFLIDVVDAPSFSYVMINMYEKYNDELDGSLLLFVYGNAHVKSSRSRQVRRSGAPSFLYAMICVHKIVEAERYIDRKPLALMLTGWHIGCVCVHGSAPCVDRGRAYERAKHRPTSVCAERLSFCVVFGVTV
jgi:hypothetical protein